MTEKEKKSLDRLAEILALLKRIGSLMPNPRPPLEHQALNSPCRFKRRDARLRLKTERRKRAERFFRLGQIIGKIGWEKAGEKPFTAAKINRLFNRYFNRKPPLRPKPITPQGRQALKGKLPKGEIRGF